MTMAARCPASSLPANNHAFLLWAPIQNRKAWLFSDTPAGARSSTVIYSLVQTAKANGLEPYTWLRRVLRDLPAAKSVDAVQALLPWNLRVTDLVH
jgi:hypothetical protein